jgi:hypothetical protein
MEWSRSTPLVMGHELTVLIQMHLSHLNIIDSLGSWRRGGRRRNGHRPPRDVGSPAARG